MNIIDQIFVSDKVFSALTIHLIGHENKLSQHDRSSAAGIEGPIPSFTRNVTSVLLICLNDE